MKRIMIVGGGFWQVDLVKTAKSMGFYVISSNLYSDSPTKEFADVFEVADILDKETNLAIAKKHNAQYVTSDQSDIAVPTVAYICEKMGLKGIGQEKASLFTNKYKMRVFCKEHGYSVPAFKLCSSSKEAVEFWKEHKKIVVKPLDSLSSRGVSVVSDQASVSAAFADALAFSRVEKKVLVEEFMEGTEFTVDGIKTEHPHKSLAISEKKHYSEFPMVASSLKFTQQNKNFDYDKLKEQNDNLVEEMGLPFGITHAEYIYTNQQFYLVEIAARGGG